MLFGGGPHTSRDLVGSGGLKKAILVVKDQVSYYSCFVLLLMRDEMYRMALCGPKSDVFIIGDGRKKSITLNPPCCRFGCFRFG